MANVKDFGAVGDGKSDDTEAIHHAVNDGDGVVKFPPGRYLISKPVEIDLKKTGFITIIGSGGTARVIMAGVGPAFRLVGNHMGTASPPTVKPVVWERERFPTITGIEIIGAHNDAVGIELRRTMQVTIQQVAIRNVRNGVHLVERNRNFLMTACHIYDNREIGVFFDNCNLHQVILSANHISYNRHAGIKSLAGDLHNLQITGNDIEYNHDTENVGSADIYFDARDGIASEITIASNTIQAVPTEGGANVRIVGKAEDPPRAARLIAITGNVLGSQETNIDAHNVDRTTVNGNTIYDGERINIESTGCHHLVVSGNTFDWRAPRDRGLIGGVRLTKCSNVVLNSLVLENCRQGSETAGGAVNIIESSDCSISSCNILDPQHRGVWIDKSVRCRVSDNSIVDRHAEPIMQAGIEIASGSRAVVIQNNLLSNGTRGAIVDPMRSGVVQGNNQA